MAQRITKEMLDTKFAAVARAANDAGLVPDGHSTVLENFNGRWHVMLRNNVDGGRSSFAMLSGNGYLGHTKSAAWDALDVIWCVLLAVHERDREREGRLRVLRDAYSNWEDVRGAGDDLYAAVDAADSMRDAARALDTER